jgi:hypothetical protein
VSKGHSIEETAKSTDEEDKYDTYTLDEYGCPILTENEFWCSQCGGADADGKCKGVSRNPISLTTTLSD